MDDLEQSRHRLASARRRVDAFAEQIVQLRNSSFPHEDGKEALGYLDAHFVKIRARLGEELAALRPDLVDDLCANAIVQVGKSIVILGLILRSTNVRNPFELHYALGEMVRRTIGDDVRVLVSSEWQYTPFTWPMNFDILPTFVIIGTPASESGNALVSPLAGHEIGHTAWRRYSVIRDESAKAIGPAVDAQLLARPSVEKRLLEQMKLDDLGRRSVAERCSYNAAQQIEEIFCDFFGLHLFGTAYLHAYDYFIAPGADMTTLSYPSDLSRLRFLVEAATDWSMHLDRDFTERWMSPKPPKGEADMHEIVTAAVAEVVPMMRTLLSEEMQRRGLVLPREQRVKDVLEAFRRNEPHEGEASFAEIIIAGWRRLANPEGMAGKSDTEKLRILNDLILKSVEVAEYRDKVSRDA
ncbi:MULTISPECIES: hypothetical protein [Sphingosinicellaceae]|uniref:hypothetical protein n=1 Tax=Sphingosinicellaceae TaxID=2820280 RepID=UPI001C1E7481|nr:MULTISPECIES: hypothetical protein [Polymorphobacter]QYE35686.1 hypothetical protein KZX46_06845 [Polymorphobacter sp. PAMC 29334]UAJ10946.1 hypothetical protein KTC28_04315 [Polymorphobacter megasporae]